MSKRCPLIRKACMKHDCEWYTLIQGKNPQNGQDVNEWACAIAFLPMLLIENAQQIRGVQAATESFRNEVTEGHKRNFVIEAGKFLNRLPHAS